MGRAETVAYLRGLITEAQDQIVALCDEKTKPAVRQKFAEIRALEIAIQNIPGEVYPQKFAIYKRAIDAVEDYLKEQGVPCEREKIVQELIAGGFRGATGDSATSIRKSIGHHVETAQGLAKKKIRAVEGVIGLYDWPDSKFIR